jgi:hypothetical protein
MGILAGQGGIEMLIPCRVSKGLRDKEVMVEVTDYHDRTESMPLDKDFVVYKGNKSYLPVRVLHIHEGDQAALITLPVESDSGAHRIWVKLEGTRETERAPA